MMKLNDYLRLNYKMEIVEDPDEGGYAIALPELPGCLSTGETIEEAIKKMEEQLDEDERIIDYQVLKINIKEDKIILDIFFTVYENITSYSAIEGEENVS